MTASPGNAARRVLIIVENLPVPFDRRVWLEATALRSAGYSVAVISPTGRGCESLRETIDGIEIYRHALPAEQSSLAGYLREYGSALWNEWRLARRARRECGFDVVHLCNPPDFLFLVALWFKAWHGARVLFDHHDLSPELYESKFGRRGLMHSALRLAERLTFCTADRVLSTNESYREVAIRRGRMPPQCVTVVRSGPDLSRFNRVPAVNTFHRGRAYLVGYLGVMGEFDGVEHLLRAARALVADRGRADIQFVLIGGGPMLETLRKMAVELGIADCVEFTGRIPDADMIARLSSCDVCVDPDPLNPLNDRSTMNKILEYMALERPVVQYDLLEGRRSAGEASLYATPNDPVDLAAKIESLLADPERRRRMGALGRRRMEEELEWRHQKPKLLAAYEEFFRAIGK